MLWVLWIYWRLYKGLCASLGAHAAFCSFQKHIIFCSRSGIRALVLTRHCLAERSRWIWPDPQNVETLFQFSALIFFFSLSPGTNCQRDRGGSLGPQQGPLVFWGEGSRRGRLRRPRLDLRYRRGSNNIQFFRDYF